MRLPKFTYLSPSSLEEALSMVAEYRERAKVIAGGTDLLPNMKQRLIKPEYLIDLKAIDGMDTINDDDVNGLRIKPLVTLRQIQESQTIKERYPGLIQAAREVGAIPQQNIGTIGGNICLDTRCLFYNQPSLWRKNRKNCFKLGGEICYAVKGGKKCFAVYQGDTAPMLIALKSKVRLKNMDGERMVELENFFTGKGDKPLDLKDEILSEILIPRPSLSSF